MFHVFYGANIHPKRIKSQLNIEATNPNRIKILDNNYLPIYS